MHLDVCLVSALTDYAALMSFPALLPCVALLQAVVGAVPLL
jgi:hypothetical protein